MSKVKYYYDSESLSYRKIGRKKSTLFISIASYLIVFFLGVSLDYFDVFPKSKYRTEISKKDIDSISNHLKKTEQLLNYVENHIDDNLLFIAKQKDAMVFNFKDWDDKIQSLKAQVTDKELIIDDLDKTIVKLEKAKNINIDDLKAREEVITIEVIKRNIGISVTLLLFSTGLGMLLRKYKKNIIIRKIYKKLKYDKIETEKKLAEYKSGFTDAKSKLSIIESLIKEERDELLKTKEELDVVLNKYYNLKINYNKIFDN